MANEFARALRKSMTPQEVKLWVNLRAMKEHGFHFRRQAPVGPYVADFMEKRRKLVIEVDGSQHGEIDHENRDRRRDAFIVSQGFRVLRFWNIDVDRAMDGVIVSVFETLKSPHPAAARPPSPGGEG